MNPTASPPGRAAFALATGAYVIWGLLPLYLKLIGHVPAVEVVAYRVLWSLALLMVLVAVLGRLGSIARAMADLRVAGTLLTTALLISFNWLVYIWAVQHGHVLESSLGYFINPLLNVALAMIFLRERLRRGQIAALGLAAAGVVLLGVAQGGAVWISLALALSFGLYGLLRKVVAIDALGGLAVETAILAPIAALYVGWAAADGTGSWGRDLSTDLLLVASGIVTAAPLLMFAAAARRMRYSTLSLFQYIAPTLQFLLAVFLFGEALTAVYVVTFVLIWIGLALYAIDSARALR